MATSSDMRIMRLEGLVSRLQQQVTQLQGLVGAVQQQQFGIQPAGAGGSGGGATYLAYPTSDVGYLQNCSCSINQVAAGSISTGAGVLWNYLASTMVEASTQANGQLGVICLPDGQGGFTAVSQSCQ